MHCTEASTKACTKACLGDSVSSCGDTKRCSLRHPQHFRDKVMVYTSAQNTSAVEGLLEPPMVRERKRVSGTTSACAAAAAPNDAAGCCGRGGKERRARVQCDRHIRAHKHQVQVHARQQRPQLQEHRPLLGLLVGACSGNLGTQTFGSPKSNIDTFMIRELPAAHAVHLGSKQPILAQACKNGLRSDERKLRAQHQMLVLGTSPDPTSGLAVHGTAQLFQKPATSTTYSKPLHRPDTVWPHPHTN